MKTNFGEFRITSLRETPSDRMADAPAKVADYMRTVVMAAPTWNPDVEQMVVILTNTRNRIIGHSVIGVGIVDQVLCHPREVMRPVIVGAASGFILVHNHPSGDPSPSEADIKLTRDIKRAADLFRIPMHDHVIMGDESVKPGGYSSLREYGILSF